MSTNRERREFQLSATASRILDKLADAYNCNFSDTVEGLLLGTVDPRTAHAMAEHGLSESEARVFCEMADERA